MNGLTKKQPAGLESLLNVRQGMQQAWLGSLQQPSKYTPWTSLGVGFLSGLMGKQAERQQQEQEQAEQSRLDIKSKMREGLLDLQKPILKYAYDETLSAGQSRQKIQPHLEASLGISDPELKQEFDKWYEKNIDEHLARKEKTGMEREQQRALELRRKEQLKISKGSLALREKALESLTTYRESLKDIRIQREDKKEEVRIQKLTNDTMKEFTDIKKYTNYSRAAGALMASLARLKEQGVSDEELKQMAMNLREHWSAVKPGLLGQLQELPEQLLGIE